VEKDGFRIGTVRTAMRYFTLHCLCAVAAKNKKNKLAAKPDFYFLCAETGLSWLKNSSGGKKLTRRRDS
jgi:hypothetical protein